MTREEAKAILIREIDDDPFIRTEYRKQIHEALNMSIKALDQEPKTGHWVNGEYCSECGCDVPAYIIDWQWKKDMDAKYCPNCGARMVEPQESEAKE